MGRGPWAVGVPAASTYKLALLLRHFVVRIKQQRAEKVYKMKQRQVQADQKKEKKRNCLRKENPKARQGKATKQEKEREKGAGRRPMKRRGLR